MIVARLTRAFALAGLLAGATFVAAMLGGSLQQHMLAHVLLVDAVAALLVLVTPADARRRICRRIDEAALSGRARAVPAHLVRSPLALLALWTIILTSLMTPPGHERMTNGAAPVIEAFILLAVGVAFWRATFVQHQPQPVTAALLHGGLRWWGRHAFAMIGRIAILPAIMLMWYAPSGSYAGASSSDQIEAASIVLGAEMLIFSAAAVLFLILFVRDDSHRSVPHGV